MAGTVTATYLPKRSKYGADVNVVQVDWTSDASGNATGSVSLYGFVHRVVTVPSGSAAPTNLYDITLVDSLGSSLDALGGALADRSSTNTEQKVAVLSGGVVPVLLCGDYTFTVANAGNAKQGTAYFILTDDI